MVFTMGLTVRAVGFRCLSDVRALWMLIASCRSSEQPSPPPIWPPVSQQPLVAGLTALAVSTLGKSAGRTTVCLDLPPAGRYFVAGRPMEGCPGAHVEVSLTAGTHSTDEKARFLREAYQLLPETLGASPQVAGAALYELRPEGYGYNGVTQLVHYRQ